MNTLKEEMIKRVEELNEKLEEKEFHLEVKEAFMHSRLYLGKCKIKSCFRCKYR